jgi:hypothetical protein
MSALPPKADMCSATLNVRFVPIADMKTSSLSIVGSASERLTAATIAPSEISDAVSLQDCIGAGQRVSPPMKLGRAPLEEGADSLLVVGAVVNLAAQRLDTLKCVRVERRRLRENA